MYDVIIVGGGLAGLSAARQVMILQPGWKTLLLEARPEIGGRVRPFFMFTENSTRAVDMG